MPPSARTHQRLASADWRAWLALAWASYFAFLYCGAVLDSRGPKIRAAISAAIGNR